MQYTLVCQNESPMSTQFCIYQRFPKESSAVSLAWICQNCAPHARTRFQWKNELYFVWGYTQRLSPGENLFTAQYQSVREAESVRLHWPEDAPPSFQALMPSVSGSLLISTSAAVPNDSVFVGLGMRAERMSDTAALVLRAGPNARYPFEQDVEYHLAYLPSGSLRGGDILDLNALNSSRIKFPSGVSDLVATLDDANRLTFKQSGQRSD